MHDSNYTKDVHVYYRHSDWPYKQKVMVIVVIMVIEVVRQAKQAYIGSRTCTCIINSVVVLHH